MVDERDLPETMVSPETGEVLRRDVRPFVVRYRGESIAVDLPGYYADGHDNGVLVGDDMAAADEALRQIKRKLAAAPSPEDIRRVRSKLKLSQREAGQLLKVGESAFDKYERGLIEPSGPTIQLIKLLDRHPELIDELR